jgi:NCAIR mutase (PurE)-related protein
MNLREILLKLTEGEITIQQAQKEISIYSIEYVGNNLAQIDLGRDMRKGTPEVIFAEGKDQKDIIRIALSMVAKKGLVLISKVKEEQISSLYSALKKRRLFLEVGKKSSTILVSKSFPLKFKDFEGKIGILAAGTADIGVAEEARLIAKAMGCTSLISYDVGIAGIHRLFPVLKEIVSQDVDALVVVAGMEGALPSIVSSLVDIPVIAVPTSTGYGFASDGLAALGTMLQSCTFGLAVVNIDNGIGAGAFAATIARRRHTK